MVITPPPHSFSAPGSCRFIERSSLFSIAVFVAIPFPFSDQCSVISDPARMKADSTNQPVPLLITDHCLLTTLSHLAGAEGFEPPSSVLETDSLAVELTPL
jgi:hypothetical protein